MLRKTLPLATGAFVLALGLTACSRGNAGTNDQALAASVQQKINSDSTLQGSSIKASAENGVVTLSGSAPSEAERTQAAQDAQVPGATQINNQIATNLPANAAPTAEDEAASNTSVRASDPSRRNDAASARNESPAPTMTAATPVEIETGTRLHVRLGQALSSETASEGQTFSGTLSQPILVDGRIAIPKDAQVTGSVVLAHSAGHFKGRSSLELALTQVAYNGQTYTLHTHDFVQEGKSRGKRSAETIGGGAGLGALIGALAGHGKGAAIGAAVGAGAGTATQVITKPDEVRLPAETVVSFTLSRPVQVVPAAANR